MTTQEIASMIAEISVPFAYRMFTEDTAVPPPFICFYYDGSNNFDADDQVFVHGETLIVELYTNRKDFALEERAQEVFDAHEIPWDRSETWINSEKMYEVIYALDVLITPSNAKGD
ncbi:MAG: hypothetical protein IJD20_00880 [Oscillospiraceae bacterium]|nr:hypothetical protein [Oscillospiraceae bacterium]